MAVYFRYLVKSDLSVYAIEHVYTGQVTLYMVTENTSMLIWSSCIILYSDWNERKSTLFFFLEGDLSAIWSTTTAMKNPWNRLVKSLFCPQVCKYIGQKLLKMVGKKLSARWSKLSARGSTLNIVCKNIPGMRIRFWQHFRALYPER